MKRIFCILLLSFAAVPFVTGCGSGNTETNKQPKMVGDPKPGGLGPAELPSQPGGGGIKPSGGSKPGAAVE